MYTIKKEKTKSITVVVIEVRGSEGMSFRFSNKRRSL